MTNGSRSRLRAALAVPCVALVALAGLLAPATLTATPAAAAEPTVTIDGRGWGHGRGMSQYGALGYAVDHGWDWRQILGHYYSNTTEGALPDGRPISVALTAMGTGDTIVQREDGELKTSATGDATAPAWLVRPVDGSRYEVFSGPGCAGPWTSRATVSTTEVRVFNPLGQDDSVHHSQLLQVCEPNGGRHWYRGDIRARRSGSVNRTVNVTTVERYLRGVVPRESPASWASAGGGRGAHALRAQAVAARSYAEAEDRTSSYGADTCDTTSCQVYAGAWRADPGRGPATMEDSRTDQAIADTRNVVRVWPGGAVARTEFSSSTGGWTAGGTFPAVQDLGDATANNQNHTWRSQLKVSAIEATYRQIGRFTGIQVTQRNGLGADGGRVLRVVIRGTGGQVSITGNEFRTAFGAAANCTSTTGTQSVCIKSDWFAPRFVPAAAVAVADTGYWVARSDGTVEPFAGAAWHGDMGGTTLAAPVLGMATPPGGAGYWMVAADGGIFSFNTSFHGSTGGMRLNQPVVGMASTATGNGYWLVARDGGIFSFGDALFYGSTGAMRLNQPVVGMARTATGNGYWLVARDGGIFTFGDASFHGSTGAIWLNQPIVGMAPTPSGNGYWLVAADGGIFAGFGDSGFYGSLGGTGAQAVGMAPTRSGLGYWIVTSDGTAHPFGDAA